jgi:hypothetical protein
MQLRAALLSSMENGLLNAFAFMPFDENDDDVDVLLTCLPADILPILNEYHLQTNNNFVDSTPAVMIVYL